MQEKVFVDDFTTAAWQENGRYRQQVLYYYTHCDIVKTLFDCSYRISNKNICICNTHEYLKNFIILYITYLCILYIITSTNRLYNKYTIYIHKVNFIHIMCVQFSTPQCMVQGELGNFIQFFFTTGCRIRIRKKSNLRSV